MERLPLIDNVLLAYKQIDCRWGGSNDLYEGFIW